MTPAATPAGDRLLSVWTGDDATLLPRLVDCDLEEMECPFKDVDFDKVTRNEIIETKGILELQKIIDHNHKMLRKVR